MRMRSAVALLLPLLCVLFLHPVTSARATEPLRVMETGPANHAVIEGQLNSFYVRFDRPVDHIHSELQIERDGRVIETLQPRFEAAPEVLYAASPTLLPGDYRLRWKVITMEGKDVFNGGISFTIKMK